MASQVNSRPSSPESIEQMAQSTSAPASPERAHSPVSSSASTIQSAAQDEATEPSSSSSSAPAAENIALQILSSIWQSLVDCITCKCFRSSESTITGTIKSIYNCIVDENTSLNDKKSFMKNLPADVRTTILDKMVELNKDPTRNREALQVILDNVPTHTLLKEALGAIMYPGSSAAAPTSTQPAADPAAESADPAQVEQPQDLQVDDSAEQTG